MRILILAVSATGTSPIPQFQTDRLRHPCPLLRKANRIVVSAAVVLPHVPSNVLLPLGAKQCRYAPPRPAADVTTREWRGVACPQAILTSNETPRTGPRKFNPRWKTHLADEVTVLSCLSEKAPCRRTNPSPLPFHLTHFGAMNRQTPTGVMPSMNTTASWSWRKLRALRN